MRTMICMGLVLLLAGCIPIGIRGSTQFASDKSQNMCWPPLIAMFAPVTNAASSLDR